MDSFNSCPSSDHQDNIKIWNWASPEIEKIAGKSNLMPLDNIIVSYQFFDKMLSDFSTSQLPARNIDESKLILKCTFGLGSEATYKSVPEAIALQYFSCLPLK